MFCYLTSPSTSFSFYFSSFITVGKFFQNVDIILYLIFCEKHLMEML